MILAFIAMMFAFACEKDSVVSVKGDADAVEYRSSVEPVFWPEWQSGNAYSECGQTGDECYEYAWKVDANAPNGTYYTNTDQYGNTPTDFEAIITISNSDGYTFDWSISTGYAVCAVIVSKGNVANVYSYPDGATSDSGLITGAYNTNGQLQEISHVTFCFKKVNGECYQDETAWAFGSRYVARGNWATYTPYPGANQEVDIFAGQTMLAGTATFSAPVEGMINIAIELKNGFVFYYDKEDDDNLKVQDYAEAPKGNPAPGLFAWKYTVPVGNRSKTITVSYDNFYGIHLDVAYPVPCD